MMPPVQTLLDEYRQAVKSEDAMATARLAFALAVRLEACRTDAIFGPALTAIEGTD